GGTSWADVYSQPGNGDSGESAFTRRTVSLINQAGQLTQLRFNFYFLFGSYFAPVDPGDGWTIDDILLTNAQVATVVSTNTTSTTNFTFNPPQPGTYFLDARALIFTEFPLDWGPAKSIVATTNAPSPVI